MRGPLIIEDKSLVIPSAINRTSETKAEVLIFNKVPKTASSTLVALMQELGKTLNITHAHVPRDNSPYHSYLAEAKNLMFQYKQTWPYSSDQHWSFMDATHYWIPRDEIPLWINLVRDPVKRYASQFYFQRARAYHEHTSKTLVSEKLYVSKFFFNIFSFSFMKQWLNLNLDDCVASGDALCAHNKGFV